MYRNLQPSTLRFGWLICLTLIGFQSLSAKKVLDGLNFEEGTWAMVGVPLHNYKLLPIQQELGTFLTTNIGFMKELQTDWDLNLSFDEKCDHHYALKIYHNQRLVRTLKLNLHCQYLSFDGFAYSFDPSEFTKFRAYAKPVPWSRIGFQDAQLLRKAIGTLEQRDWVYWYDDVYPYQYPGYFMLAIDELPWDTDRDSLFQVVGMKIMEKTGSRQFYLSEDFHMTRGYKMDIRYLVNCDERLAKKLKKYQHLPWRSHLDNEEGKVYIVAIGINEENFRQLMDN